VDARAAVEPDTDFLQELLASGLLVSCGVQGVYGRSATFEDVIERIDECVKRAAAGDAAIRLRFPPILSRSALEKSGYLQNMPQLAGIVHSFTGDAAEHLKLIQSLEQGADWTAQLRPTDVVLTPAACYPLYPTQTGEIGRDGRLFDIYSYCFRHEPSGDPARMQAFRMREYVRLGKPDQVRDFRERWLERGRALLEALGLAGEQALANDPFFGRTGRMLAQNQRDLSLKHELVVPITGDRATAVMSFNYHQDLFGKVYQIQIGGEPAHSACVGFGMEHIALALFKTHGLKPEDWPISVRGELWP
jgi:seryl-tRNA synthetase